VRGAVRFLSSREKGDILQPSTDIDEKTGGLAEMVLRSKHPDTRIPKPEYLPKYANTSNFVLAAMITADAIKKVQLSGRSGLGGTDSHALKHWLLRFGVASQKHSLSPCRLH
jgi:hypothetical protein